MKYTIPLLILAVFFSGRLFAQEVQIPFDSAGKIEVVTEGMENHLQLFLNYPHFHEARLFKQNDDAYILEVTSLDDGKLSRSRVPKTKREILVLQTNFSEAVSERSPSIMLDQSSRSKFLVWETLFGSLVYGPLLISSSTSPNVGVGTGIELVVGGLGFIVPYVLTKNSPMTDGESSLALGGAFLGLGHGALIDLLLTNGNPGREIGAITCVASILETGIGYEIARTTNMSEGKADVIRYCGLFGAMQGAGIAGEIILDNANPSAPLISGLTLLGSAGGFYAGTLMTNSQNYSRGNASVLLTAGMFGTFILPALYSSAFANSNYSSGIVRGSILSGMIGNLGGIVLAHSLMRGRHFSTSEGNDVILGTSAGFLVGGGIGYIISSGTNANKISAWSLSLPLVLGTSAGFAIMVYTIGKGSGDEKSTGWNMNVNPGALLGALVPARRSSSSLNAYVPPALSVQYRW